MISFSTWGQFESRKTNIVLFFLSYWKQISLYEAFTIVYVYANFLKHFVRKWITKERKGNSKRYSYYKEMVVYKFMHAQSEYFKALEW